MIEDSSHTLEISVPFNCTKDAEIACQTLSVDKEPKRGGCIKILKVQDNHLVIKISSEEYKKLRVSTTSVMNHLFLVSETIRRFTIQD